MCLLNGSPQQPIGETKEHMAHHNFFPADGGPGSDWVSIDWVSLFNFHFLKLATKYSYKFSLKEQIPLFCQETNLTSFPTAEFTLCIFIRNLARLQILAI